ncbi:MAG: ATP-binding cassette domain-containing protein [Desulfobulbaceae bacterium]|nr:ATP-binding cassette domain-containing protein [Desulfobulbaceae bacterium]
MRNYGYFEEGQIGSVKDIHLWRRILGYCVPYISGLAAAVIQSILITAATIGLPKLMQMGIDNFMIAAGMTPEERVDGLGRLAMVYGGLIGVVFLSGFVQVVVLEWVGQSIMHRLRQDLFSHMIRLDLSFFHSQPTGRLVTRLTNDIHNMHEMFTSVMVTLFNDFLKLAGILVVLYWMNVQLALVMTVFVPLSFGITFLFSRLARDRFRAIRSQLAKLNSFLQEAVSAVSIIQLFGRQQASRKQYEALTGEYVQRTLSQIRLFGTFMPLTEFLGSFAVAVILWYGGGEIIRQKLTLGELVAFLSYMRLFFQPMRELSQKYSIVQSAMASAERIFELLDKRPGITIPDHPLQPEKIRGIISYDNVSFGYDQKKEVLHGITLDIKAGETLALVGSTGSGKSTLISLLVRFYEPDKGKIMLDNRDLSLYSLGELRRIIGVIMQDVFILPDTVLANIVLDGEVAKEKIEQILQQTGMESFIERLPKGLQTRIGEGGLDLSTGEKQLVSFARVLCRDPAVLVLDEATAAIDTESENILERAVDVAFKGRTSLVIAHRLSTVRRVDRIVVMDQGRIIEQGSHDQLMAVDSVYKKLVHLDRQKEAGR